MQILNDQFDLDKFYDDLKASNNRLLMLDYDGTLAPFVVERDQAFPYPEIVVTLTQLLEANTTRVVIISGRTVDDLKKLLDLDSLPELWGCHGLERLRADGHYQIEKLPEETTSKLASLYTWISENQLLDSCEFKPSGAAFHWRGRSAAEGAIVRDRVMERWKGAEEESALELLDFDSGIEVRVAGTNKSIPVEMLLNDAGADVMAAYLGDDLTDEDAFAAIKGSGIGVLVRDELRDTQADLWLTPPGDLVDFLKRWT